MDFYFPKNQTMGHWDDHTIRHDSEYDAVNHVHKILDHIMPEPLKVITNIFTDFSISSPFVLIAVTPGRIKRGAHLGQLLGEYDVNTDLKLDTS